MNKTEDSNYCVYKHICPDGMVYVGMTNDVKQRWRKTHYNHKPFTDWIEQFGWDNILHIVEFENLTKTEASRVENMLIEFYSELGKSLNNNKSGYDGTYRIANRQIRIDLKQIHKHTQKEHKKEMNLKQKEYRDIYYHNFRRTNEGKIYNRVAAYNQYCTKYNKINKIIETPAEARQKYKDYGYVPNYIKNDDLL